MACLSHPDKQLITHLSNVRDIGLDLFCKKKKLQLSFNAHDIKTALDIMLYYHDFGKATKFFQEYLQAAIKNEKYTKKSDLTHHALLSAIFAAYKIHNEINDKKIGIALSIVAFIAVRKHHGNLESINNMLVISKSDWRILEEQWNSVCFDDFKEIEKSIFKKIKEYADNLLWEADNIDKNQNFYFLINLLFSILTYSDKTDVILGKSALIESPDKIEILIDKYKRKIFKNSTETPLNKVRNEIYEISETEIRKSFTLGKIYSINVPTGSGKTLTVINAALKMLQEENSLTKIIYALPYTSIIDQTGTILKNAFRSINLDPGKLLIIHHHLAEAKIIDDENLIEGDKAQFIIENWDKPFVLTTFWQLFHSLISNDNAQLRKIHNIANSIIILDEIQTLPHKYWLLAHDVINTFVTMFNCRIILLTATMPLIFQEEKNEVIPLIPSKKREEYFSKFSRYSISPINELKNITLDELTKIALKHIEEKPEKSFLFVFNTIKSSLLFFKKLGHFPEDQLIYLSTNILPIDRKERIKAIKDNSAGKIIVSTQLVEAGVDIDLDVVYRDFAPLDSIVQAAGRCNRNNRGITGEVYLFRLKNSKNKNDCNIYKEISLEATEELFSGKSEIKESELLNTINCYYQKIKDKSSTQESCALLNAIKNLDYDFIINSFKLIDEIPSFLIFIEKDESASQLLAQFKEIMSIKDNFKRKNKFIKIKNKFYEYALSLKLNNDTKSIYTSFAEIGHLRIIEKDFAGSLYKKDIGFSEDDNIFI